MSYLGDRLHPWLRSLLLPPHAITSETPSWQPLDPPSQSYYRCKESRMSSFSYFQETIADLRQYRWVCLILATLLLYNPFFAVPHSGNGLEIGHRASHRATVGASELQHFTPIDGWGALPATDAGTAAVVLPLPEPMARLFFSLPLVPRFSQEFFGSGLWFRPPPTR